MTGRFEYQTEYEVAVQLVHEAAQLFKPAFNSSKNIETKESSSDLVTETDKAIEKLLHGRIKAEFPDHVFIGEETVSDGGKCVFGDSPTWIIDPIDGTMNFVHRYPDTCIVIGFGVNRKMQFGVIYNPCHQELYTGRKGHGAECNGFPINVTGETQLNRALLICEMGGRRDAVTMEIKARNMSAVCSEPDPCHGLRMQGSAALNMCCVAAGRADGYWESGLHVWDMAAASLILTEAGGCVVSPVEGEEFSLMRRRVVAAASSELATVLQSKIEHVEFPSD